METVESGLVSFVVVGQLPADQIERPSSEEILVDRLHLVLQAMEKMPGEGEVKRFLTCPPKSHVQKVMGPRDVRGVLSHSQSEISRIGKLYVDDDR